MKFTNATKTLNLLVKHNQTSDVKCKHHLHYVHEYVNAIVDKERMRISFPHLSYMHNTMTICSHTDFKDECYSVMK